MSFRVICISRTTAAGGENIGDAVAQRLGFRYVDEQIIERAAQLAQVDAKLVEASEHHKPLLQRLIDKLATAYDLASPVSLATGVPVDAFVPVSVGYQAVPEDLRQLIRAAIHEVAQLGGAVIVAHAASMALAGTANVLRVLITASPATRAQRLSVARGLETKAATAAVAQSDRERSEYFRDFYEIKEELPTHYDMVINTDVLTPQQAVELIVTAAA